MIATALYLLVGFLLGCVATLAVVWRHAVDICEPRERRSEAVIEREGRT